MDPVQKHDYGLTPRSVNHRMALSGIQVESRNRNYCVSELSPHVQSPPTNFTAATWNMVA